MKLRTLFTIACMSVITCFHVSAGEKKEAFKTIHYKVYGNCGTCKKAIDGAVKKAPGIKTASWNKDTKIMQVTYDPAKISENEIQQKVADAGYDTETKKGNDKAYASLPGCCQYDRK